MKTLNKVVQKKLKEDIVRLFQRIISEINEDKIVIYDITCENVPKKVLNDGYIYDLVDVGERKIILHYRNK